MTVDASRKKAFEPPSERLVAIGRVVRPHGVLGEILAHPFTQDLAPWEAALKAPLFLSSDPQGPFQPAHLESYRTHGQFILAAFEGFTDRTAVEKIGKPEILIERDDLPELEKDAYYHCDLVGLEVFDGATGEWLGRVERVEESAAKDQLVIRRHDGRPFFIPFTRPFIEEVNLEARRVRLDLPPGLVELND